ncbi:hypothetical protein BAUCODRAFT_131376 [Baudoinia panamericana UAMH 10762]|uniref:Uncharacterized protein n=1 Tax=Baudoinia panamericana (strain UAMH 10762) TaxID=717646 RepID=M2MFY7_BAUPA|nr:uncharacterized protein BAUCODRAFT_131376 [Baudoinia panamericana UAMH 10762]EMC95531.1 hypothetical protein BAUCODRAFT_131376 [Baudoinia panamericana UAMH 10762]
MLDALGLCPLFNIGLLTPAPRPPQGLTSTLSIDTAQHQAKPQYLFRSPTMTKIEYAMAYNKCTTNELYKFIADRSGQPPPTSPGRKRAEYIRILGQLDEDMEPFRFLHLAPEMRNLVYKDLLSPGPAPRFYGELRGRRRHSFPELLCACYQINQEADSMLYAGHKVAVRITGRTYSRNWPRANTQDLRTGKVESVIWIDEGRFNHQGIPINGTPSLKDQNITWPAQVLKARHLAINIEHEADHMLAHLCQAYPIVNKTLYGLVSALVVHKDPLLITELAGFPNTFGFYSHLTRITLLGPYMQLIWGEGVPPSSAEPLHQDAQSTAHVMDVVGYDCLQVAKMFLAKRTVLQEMEFELRSDYDIVIRTVAFVEIVAIEKVLSRTVCIGKALRGLRKTGKEDKLIELWDEYTVQP